MARAALPGCGLRATVVMSDAAMPSASLAGMFGVSNEQKAKMEARERERTIAAKRKKEQDAKERKRKREVEKARIAQYEEAAAQDAAASPQESPAARSRRVVKSYLDNPPYFGSSNFEDHKAVVELCKGTKNRLEVNKQTKPWQYGTGEAAAVARLIGSGLWHPVGVMPKDHALLVKTIGELELQEAIAAEKLIAEKTNASELHAQAAEEREAREKARLDAAERSGRDPDHAEHVAYLEQIGFGADLDALLAQSARWADLGPTCGLSVSERILRWIHIQADWEWEKATDVHVPRPIGEAQERAGKRVVAELLARASA